MAKTIGGFTLPGEKGYEALTMRLAGEWGADCIRDSDGTQLSDEILKSGIPIYSTICMVRSITAWAKSNMDKLQRNFLMSAPVLAETKEIVISPLDGYFREQFIIAPWDDPKEFWQVFDRTEGNEHADWSYDGEKELVTVHHAKKGHIYTVNFLATRIWEEISMYNHITNDWGDKEHLMAVEPRYPETQEALLSFLDEWLREHKHTRVVRFTSMFYNFCWIWSDSKRNRDVFSDWGSYDFSVNPVSLRAFEAEYGYRPTSEDFINAGRHNPVHNPPSRVLRDWMEFTGKFVREFGKKCVDLVHKHGKLAYVFYDDTWVGIEPWSGHFGEFSFDGLIKCVFNAFEARLCAGVSEVKTHELRLHPYLFPTGLTGEPTFAPGGHPEKDARRYWACVRRALLRVKIDRIGLGGYLSLTEPFLDFQKEVRDIADEFRMLKSLHDEGGVWSSGIRVAVLHSWGSLRTWNCSGHMHEHPELYLNHLYEAMAGLPVEVRAISFDEVIENGVPEDVDVIINAGRAYDAWSGGDIWNNPKLVENIQKFVMAGGGLIGVGEPGAARGGMNEFKLAPILGVDRETGATICRGKLSFETEAGHFIMKDVKHAVKAFHNHVSGVYPASESSKILMAKGKDVRLAVNEFGKGRGVYLSGFTYGTTEARLLYRAILWAASREDLDGVYMTDNPVCECAYYSGSDKLIIINNSARAAFAKVRIKDRQVRVRVEAEGSVII